MSAEPTRLFRHPARCGCARCRVEAAIVLIRTGRPAMALHLLGPVPDLVVDEWGQAWTRGFDLGRRVAAQGEAPAGGKVVPFPRPAPEPQPAPGRPPRKPDPEPPPRVA